jgi:hypothetical protein
MKNIFQQLVGRLKITIRKYNYLKDIINIIFMYFLMRSL